MYVGADYSPSDNPENELYGLDFVNDLPSGDTISTASWTCTNADDTQVTDPNPSSRLVAGPFIAGTVSTARFSGFLTGVKYTLQATVTTSQGNTLNLFTHVTAETVG
jgi:hypothetical protein